MSTIHFDQLGLAGRLGNSAFQVASTIGLAATRDATPVFNADWLYRPYFSIPDACYVDKPPIRSVAAWDLVPHLDPRVRIFLQDRTLFAAHMGLVRQFFAPSELAQAEIDKATEFHALPGPVLSVHVRRGDNIFDPGMPDKWRYHPSPPASFYRDAITLRRHSFASVAVFGDDPQWSFENLGDVVDYVHPAQLRPNTFEEGYLTAPVVDYVEFFLMARCAEHILSNSTYGIFPALLAEDYNAIVCWPIHGEALAHCDASLMLRSTWQRLEYTVTRRPQ